MIELKKVKKSYNKNRSNEIRAIDNVSLRLPERGMIAIFGKSGCGKTTMLNAIGGLDTVNSGEITVMGKNIKRHSDLVRNKHIGYIFQNYCLNKEQTVFENVASALRLCGITDEREITERVLTALDNVGMKKYIKRTPDALSGGQQQRVAIARAIVKRPDIILADEPTGNIDEANTIAIMDLLKAISKESLVVLVTHEAKLVDYYCSSVIEISDGKIVSVRENSDSSGYAQRSKNTVFLGELEKSEATLPGVEIEYYGDAPESMKLRIINSGGKFYIQPLGTHVRVIDGTGEIKIEEGVFNASSPANKASQIDMSTLPPINGKHYGRLFTFKKALAESAKDVFIKRKKKMSILLSVCLFFLSAILVLSAGSFGTTLNTALGYIRTHNSSMFYVPITSDTDTTNLKYDGNEGAIDYMGIISSMNTVYDSNIVYFNYPSFITSGEIQLQTHGNLVSTKLMKDCPAVLGKTEPQGRGEVVITTAVADELIESSPVTFIDEYEDLIGLASSNYYYYSIEYSIVGIVESSEKYLFMDDLYASLNILFDNGIYMNLLPESHSPVKLDTPLADNETLLLYSPYNSTPFDSETVMISGSEYTIAETAQMLDTYLTSYETYAIQNGKMNAEQYVAEHSDELGEAGALCEWFFGYFYTLIPEYVKHLEYKQFIPWIVANHYSDEMLYYYWHTRDYYYDGSQISYDIMGHSIDEIYLYRLYFLQNGEYPESSYDAAEVYTSLPNMESLEVLAQSYYPEWEEHLSNNVYHGFEKTFILSDKAYNTLTYSIGQNDPEVMSYLYYDYEYYDPFFALEPMYYLMIHSTNVLETQRYLNEELGSANFLTPSEYLWELVSSEFSSIIGSCISFLAMLALACVFIYFIMRSSLMSRVKEIGIFRAIGVSKKNLIFKFFIDTNFVCLTTFVPGFILASAALGSISNNFLFSSYYSYTVWLAIPVFIFVYAVCLLFGMLPILGLLKRTPSNILAKYDI